MSYTQQDYQTAVSALKENKVPPDKVPIVNQRIKEFEDDQARGYKSAPTGAKVPVQEPAQPTLGEVNAGFGPSYLENSQSPTAEVIRQVETPEQLAARRAAVDWSQKLTTDPKLKNASKLKVFDDPADYEPPKALPGMLGSVLGKATTSYFEPTVGEFREVAKVNPRVKGRLQEQYPDFDDPTKVPDQTLEESAAYKAYADARWQHALAQALKQKQPITRVAYSDKTGSVDPNTVATNPETGKPIPGSGKRNLNLTGHLSNVMDSTMGLMTGALQGKTAGLYDVALSAADTELRDAGRGSRERSPILSTLGEIGGALDPRGVTGRAAGLLGKGASRVLGPSGLPVRAAAAGGVGAATAVLDENMRAAAELAADAMDADKSAREAVLSIIHGLPGINPSTAIAGGVGGAALDLAGAGLGAGKRAMTQGDRLRAPLANFQAEGGQMGPLMQRRLEPAAEGLRAKAEIKNTSPEDIVVEKARQPLARQRLKEQEGATRVEGAATSRDQSRLEGVEVPTQLTAKKILADASAIPRGIPADEAAARNLQHFAQELDKDGFLTAEKLDERIRRASKAAAEGRARGEKPEHYEAVVRHLRELRDEFPTPRASDEATVVTSGPDKGLFTEVDETIATPPERVIAGHRDKYGDVKGVEGYSAEKTRQSRVIDYQKKTNKRLGLPESLEAEPVLTTEPDKGLFNVKTPKEAVANLEPSVKLDDPQRREFDSAIRKATDADYSETRAEMDQLAQRTNPKIAADIRLVRQLKASDKLGAALGQAVDQLSSSGYLNAGMLKKFGFRGIPTLNSLSGGTIGATPLSPTKEALERVKRFIPDWEALHLRGGKPVRALGALRDEHKPELSDFSPEEREFWTKVIEKVTEQQRKQ